MEKDNLPQKTGNTNLPTQDEEQNKDSPEVLRNKFELKRMELENDRFTKAKELQGKALDTINVLSNNKLASKKLEADAKQTGIDNAKMFDILNKTIDKKFGQQDRAMDNAERALDEALDRWDKDIIMKSLDKLADVANTNPLANINKDIKREITLDDFDDDDFMIEI